MARLVADGLSNGVILAAALLAVLAGWLGTYFIARSILQRTAEELRHNFEEYRSSVERRIEQFQAAVKSIPSSLPSPAATPKPEPRPVAVPATPEISADLVLLITAAVTAYLGKKVRIRSAKVLQTPYELINPWAQQGRVFVQASHNLIQRGH